MEIAILEDDQDQAEGLQALLENEGHHCTLFARGVDLIKQLKRDTYDLLLLDWNVPEMDGLEVLRWVRANIEWPIPILFVTMRDSHENIVQALTQGADDYLSKPIHYPELLARMQAVTRRVERDSQKMTLEFDPYLLDRNERSITRDQQPIDLSPREFDLALFLFSNWGRVMSRAYILRSVWGLNPDVETRTLDSHISRLRSKLGLRAENGWRLTPVYNHGYRLERVDH